MAPRYETIFEIGYGTFPWGDLFHPGIAIVIGGLLVLFGHRVFGGKKEVHQILGAVLASLGVFFLFLMAIAVLPRFVSLRQAYVKGDSSIVEGVVENFRPAPALGAADESFSVQGIVFRYNSLDSTPCFHNAPYHKGPIRLGLEVRIYYGEQCIQRVDVRR
jgi:hypothetical protein